MIDNSVLENVPIDTPLSVPEPASYATAAGVLLFVLAMGRFRKMEEAKPLAARWRRLSDKSAGKPLHVVASCDEINEQVFVITAYEPSLDIFEPDYRTKKRK